jgi:hypothetical protein
MSHSTHVGFSRPPTAFGSSLFPTPAEPRASEDIGVGQCIAAAGSPFRRSFAICPRFSPSFARGVGQLGDDPDPVSSVVGSDGTSRNNKRPRGVAETFQVSENIVECQRDDSSNVLANDPSGSRECNDFAHRRPEVAVVRMRSLLSRGTERLAGKATTDEVDSTEPTQSICVNCADVFEAGDVGPVLSEHGATELVSLAEGDGAHSCSFESEAETADAAEEVEDIHGSRVTVAPLICIAPTNVRIAYARYPGWIEMLRESVVETARLLLPLIVQTYLPPMETRRLPSSRFSIEGSASGRNSGNESLMVWESLT